MIIYALRKSVVTGRGLVNTLINKLPFELHIPGYRFCGPGTKLRKRLSRGDEGVNDLDEACKEHDIAYANTKDLEKRHVADRALLERAWSRVKAKDSGLGEKTAAWITTNAMKIKTKLGMGRGRKRSAAAADFDDGGVSQRKRRRVSERLRSAKLVMGRGRKRTAAAAAMANFDGGGVSRRKRRRVSKRLRSSKKIIGSKRRGRKIIGGGKRRGRKNKHNFGKKSSLIKQAKKELEAINSTGRVNKYMAAAAKKSRIIPVPKTGGFLPLIPLFAGLSALGALTGGAAGVAKTVLDAKAAKDKLAEASRHNQTMEAIAIGKKGDGLYLKPYRRGYGLFLRPYTPQSASKNF